ncbi:hypothetical protein TREES_T100016671 [Tupaia chinensis]|uniref:Uncharacterized protein n=1 Tax=Tupaia chinensis TaxID=246437 RepID=L9L6P2_TUPCH|nr:hypothetical protein TREES_T100016671 [Tupaia chinensis]
MSGVQMRLCGLLGSGACRREGAAWQLGLWGSWEQVAEQSGSQALHLSATQLSLDQTTAAVFPTPPFHLRALALPQDSPCPHNLLGLNSFGFFNRFSHGRSAPTYGECWCPGCELGLQHPLRWASGSHISQSIGVPPARSMVRDPATGRGSVAQRLHSLMSTAVQMVAVFRCPRLPEWKGRWTQDSPLGFTPWLLTSQMQLLGRSPPQSKPPILGRLQRPVLQ